ncbi:MAG: SRPBCC domain-containing protein [Streptosporangiaceae bacterium]
MPDQEAAAGTGAAVELTDAGPAIVATLRLADCTAARALAAFTDPVLLARWWRGELTADLVPGGTYTVHFPAIPATMAGTVMSYEPGRSLEFSWAWDGVTAPPSSVTVTAEPGPDGHSAVLTIEHGPHAADEAGQAAHSEHRAGWEYFLPRLPTAVTG